MDFDVAYSLLEIHWEIHEIKRRKRLMMRLMFIMLLGDRFVDVNAVIVKHIQ